ncbi:tRNA (adenosine(37)-N6)-threonylcarbamoyltransferase complex ATPase subunit type 1 TsaE [bacterium]|nr:tRNA (adenosine(37)-N6)-threonylcarbamoyltransferase complex ATPase subunit type 1 TsaE [bacterium]
MLTTRSADETRAVAARLVAQLPVSLVVLLLIGPLGSGKTTFVQGLAQGLGINSVVTSPSFLLMKDYSEGDRPLRHVDLFRLSSLVETVPLGLAEDLPDDAVVAVEWADRFGLQVSAPRITIRFGQGADECERSLTISAETGVFPSEMLNALRAD